MHASHHTGISKLPPLHLSKNHCSPTKHNWRGASCRRVARELVERWSRPIFDQYREHDSEALKEQYNEELAKARHRRQLKEAKAAAAVNAGMPLWVFQ